MALQSSGTQILMSEIWNEIDSNDPTADSHGSNENIKLSELSDGTYDTISRGNLPANRPNTVAPHSMSEFYSYDHDATEPSFFDTMADFDISAVAGMGVSAVYSTTEQIRLNDAIGNFYGSITQTPSAGTLSIAIGDADPGENGLGGNAGGWTSNGNVTGGLAVSGNQRTFIKFKWQPGFTTVNQTLLVRLSIVSFSSISNDSCLIIGPASNSLMT